MSEADGGSARDYPKLISIGVLHMAQYFPAAFTGIALPFIFRQEGLPLEMFWLLALPAIPRWLKWLIALVVDNYGSARIGYRKSWIIPCTMIGAVSYGLLAFIPPTVVAIYPIITILLFKSFVMAAQDIAVDGFAAEAMTDAERPVGTSIIVFLSLLAAVLGAGAVVIVEQFGWPTTMLAASLLLIGAALPALLRPEPPPPEASRLRRERGERPDLLKALKRRDSLLILPYLFAFGFGGAFFSSMLGPFFADLGLSLTEFGILSVLSIIAGSGLGAVITPLLIGRYGMRTTALLSLLTLPLEAVIFYYLASTGALPGLPWIIALTTVVAFCTSIYSFVVNNSRFRWASRAQAATDYSMQSSLWNLGVWAAGSVAGIAAGGMGWPNFFLLAATLSLLAGLFYVYNFDRIEQLVLAREKLEVAAA
ncbi:MAG: MFS transporter [Pseudomonadales bacterium]|nr:MFS transporter [Pseudomonadales bacterium]